MRDQGYTIEIGNTVCEGTVDGLTGMAGEIGVGPLGCQFGMGGFEIGRDQTLNVFLNAEDIALICSSRMMSILFFIAQTSGGDAIGACTRRFASLVRGDFVGEKRVLGAARTRG